MEPSSAARNTVHIPARVMDVEAQFRLVRAYLPTHIIADEMKNLSNARVFAEFESLSCAHRCIEQLIGDRSYGRVTVEGAVAAWVHGSVLYCLLEIDTSMEGQVVSCLLYTSPSPRDS